MPLPSSPTFCVLPWLHLYVENDGHLFPCCLSSPYDQPNENAGGKPFVMQDSLSAAAARNSEHNREIRRQMLQGEWPRACESCRRIEELGSVSPRTSLNEHFLEKMPGLGRVEFTSETSLPLRSVDFRLGNRCNLRCRMCGPKASVALTKEWAELGFTQDEPAATQDFEWYEKEGLWEALFAANPAIEELTVAGGEPLINDNFPKLLDHLIQAKRAEKISLTLHTNLTSLPEGLLDRFLRFRSVNIRVSLDGTGAVNAYIRPPARWEKIHENLAALDRWAKWPFLQVHLNVTAQAYNALELGRLVRYSLGFENLLPPTLMPLHEPPELSALVLPEEIRREARARLEEVVTQAKIPEGWTDSAAKKFRLQMSRIGKFLEGERKTELFPRFVRRTLAQDEYRGQSVREAIPELAGLFHPQ